jgi:adenine-specific DNA-methyltransferase
MQQINDLMPLSHDWNKERLETLKKLFPDLFTNEGKINIEELKKIADAESVSETERYEFRWFGKSQAKRNAFTPSNATLAFDPHRSINADETQNIIIEGENLEVLKLLSASYREKIKCIYIDPPYNTGKDFVYSDNFTQDKKAYWEETGVTENGIKIDTNTESDGRYHSNWLNMMYPRLLVARQLLREDGVIFISIDDNEVHHLRKICDEVFGEDNFVANIIWERAYSPINLKLHFSENHDYIICYAKNIAKASNFGLARSEEANARYINPDNDERGVWKPADMSVGPAINEKIYEIQTPSGRIVLPPSGRCWLYTKDKFQEKVSENRIWFGENGNNVPSVKKFLSEVKDGITPMTIWKYSEVGHSQEAAQKLKTLFDGKDFFDYPKPTELIKKIIPLYCTDNDLILDFFGGSGTTAQAVTELNKEDGGNRRYILVQLPEATDEKSEAYKAGFKKISDITIARNQRVLEQIEKEKIEKETLLIALNEKLETLNQDIATQRAAAPQLALEGAGESKAITKLLNEKSDIEKQIVDNEFFIAKINNLDKGFKVFNLQKSNFPRVEFLPDSELSEAENLALLIRYIEEKEGQLNTLFSKNALVTEILLKQHFELNYSLKETKTFIGDLTGSKAVSQTIELYSDGTREAWLCLENELLGEIVEYFKVNVSQKFICLERSLNSDKKYNLKHYMGDKFYAF